MNEFYRGKKILITGFTGFLGTEIVRLLNEIDCQIIGVTRQVHGNLDRAELWREILPGVDIVFHLAAQTNLEVAEKDPAADYKNNVLPMAHLLEASKKLGNRVRLVFAGTATQAGIPEYLPLDEKHPDRPITVYDSHKLEAEKLLKRSSSRNEICGVSLRLCNLYGPGPDPKSQGRGILNHAIRDALNGKNLYWYEGHDFVRDYLHVTDAAKAFLAAGENAEKLCGKHFVIGSGRGWKFSEAFKIVAEKAAAIIGSKVRVRAVALSKPLAPIHCRNVIADSRAFSEATGWFPEINLENLSGLPFPAAEIL